MTKPTNMSTNGSRITVLTQQPYLDCFLKKNVCICMCVCQECVCVCVYEYVYERRRKEAWVCKCVGERGRKGKREAD